MWATLMIEPNTGYCRLMVNLDKFFFLVLDPVEIAPLDPTQLENFAGTVQNLVPIDTIAPRPFFCLAEFGIHWQQENIVRFSIHQL